MDLEQRLSRLADYDISFEIKQGYYHISIVYDDAWNVVSPENEYIYVENRNGVYHYLGHIGSVSMDDMFNSVDETIEYNKDLERKIELFRIKSEELQKLFSEEPYEVLETLEFRFPKKKGRKKLKKNEENEVSEENEVMEETVSKTEGTEVEEIKENVEESPPQYEEKEEEGGFFDDEDDVVQMTQESFEELEK